MTKTTEQGDVTTAMPVSPSDLRAETRDILLLHYKQGMPYGSISNIFSLAEDEVERICVNFAESFSRREYMMNVLNDMAKINRNSRARSPQAEAIAAREAEIADLRRRLTEAELKAELYQEMVRAAEAAYHIPIRKKFGAK